MVQRSPLPNDAAQPPGAALANPSDMTGQNGCGDHCPTTLSQEATAKNKAHLQVVRGDAHTKPSSDLHHVEIVDSQKNNASSTKTDATSSTSDQPQEQKTARQLSADAVKKTVQELHEAILHKNLYGYGFSSPDVEKLVNLLETLSEPDGKAVEAAYNSTFKPSTLRGDLAKYLGQDSAECSRVVGLLNRQDGKPDYASQIHTDLATLAKLQQSEDMQTAARRGLPSSETSDDRKNAESDIRKTIANLDSNQLAELKQTYAQNYPGHDLAKDLLENRNVSEASKDALTILLQKGRDQRSDTDTVALANIGLKSHRFDIFQEATVGASPAARQTLKNAGADGQIDDVFSGVERTRAHDFLARGGDSLLSLIDGNDHFYHTNKDGITQAVEHTGADEKALFAKGEQVSKTLGTDQNKAQHLSQDDRNAQAFYQKVHQALSMAGSDREVSVWEAKLLGQSGDFVGELASTHDDGWKLVHWYSGHDKNELLKKVEGLSQKDWQHFRAYPEDMDRVDQSLKTYATDAERQEIMNMLRAKVKKDDSKWTYEQAQKVGNRTVDEVFQDSGKNTAAKLDAIMNLSDKERQAYRANENGYRDHLDKMVKDQLPEGVQRDLAMRLLRQIQSGKDFDAVDKVMLGVAKNDSANAIGNIEDACKQDPTLLARLRNPQSPEDKAIKAAFDAAARAAVDKGGYGDQTVSTAEGGATTIPGQYDMFLKPLFDSGHLPLELKLKLQSSDKQGQMEEILHAGTDEQKRILAMKPDDLKGTILADPAQRQVVELAMKQGGPDAADLFRAFVLGSDSYCGRLEGLLNKMTPQQRQDLANEYFTKYKSLISNDVIGKAPDTEKFRFREVLKPTDVDVRQIALDARTEHNRHNSPMDDFIAEHWDYSKIQAQNREDELDKFITNHCQEIDKLTPEQKQQFMEAVKNYQGAERDYITSKGKLTESLVDASITAAAIAGSVFTGGVSLELCAAIGVLGAGYRVGVAQSVEGSDFDNSPQNYLRQCFKGFTAASLSCLPGGRGLAAVGEKLAPEIVEQGLLQAGMHELPSAAREALEQELAHVTRQEALAGGEKLSAKLGGAVEKALGPSASTEEKQLLKQTLQNQLKKQVTDDIKKSIPKRLLNAGEPMAINAGIGAGSNAATEVLATAVGLEDPDTLWQRVKDSAVAGAGGALVFHFGFKAIGAAYSGLKGVIGHDAQGLFAGEGTTVRHEDGSTSTVTEGERYRFRKGDQVVQMELAGSDSFNSNKPVRVRIGGQDMQIKPGAEEPIGRYNQPELSDKVSREHATVGVDANGPYIIDHSSNGTFVTRKGQTYKLTSGQPYYLKPGDEIGLGKSVAQGGQRLDISQPQSPRSPELRRVADQQRQGELPQARGKVLPGALKQSNEYGYYHEISEHIQDGFQNAGESSFDADGHFSNNHRPATVVDTANDPVLRQVIADAKARFGNLPPKQRAEAFTRYVKQLMTPEGMNSKDLNDWYSKYNSQHPGERIYLGEFIRQGKGVCSQQALLLKVLADQFPDMHATLVRGNYGGGPSLNHAWTTFDFGDGQPLVYDPRQQEFGKPYEKLSKYTPGADYRHHHRPAEAQNQGTGLKPGDAVQYKGRADWRVERFDGDNVVLVNNAEKSASFQEVQTLNPGRQMVVAEQYRLRRSTGAIEDGWILKGRDQDGNLKFSKKDSMREVVPKEALKARPQAGAEQNPTPTPQVESIGQTLRKYRLGNLEVGLTDRGGGWFYGPDKPGFRMRDVAPVKVHVTVQSPADLARVQPEVIQALRTDPELLKRVAGWKTFDPLYATQPSAEAQAMVTGKGNSGKGFTIYVNSKEDALFVQRRLDELLAKKGLGLDKPIDTGNVDAIAGRSNRVGIVQDTWQTGQLLDGHPAAKIDDAVERAMERRFGLQSGQMLSSAQLRMIESEAKIQAGLLQYGRHGELLLAPKSEGSEPASTDPDGFYLDESAADKRPFHKTDRPAMYALYRLYNLEPLDVQ